MTSAAWPYAKVLRHQLENAANRCAREIREGALTEEQGEAVLTPLRQAIAAARAAEAAPPLKRAAGPALEIEGHAPAPPAPESLAEAHAMYGAGIYGQ